ncbi:MAG: DUF885 domain-containing protein [Thermoplasmata archaeon]
MAEVSPGGAGGMAAELASIESAVIDRLFELSPGYAVFLGLHRYDGRIPNLTRPATELWTVGARADLARLRELPGDRLPPGRDLDRTLLELLLESAIFDLADSREYDRNPMAYVGHLSLTAYLVREYAPLPQRVDAMVRALSEVPRLLRDGRARLDRILPEPFVRLALSIGSGLPGHFAEAEETARRGSSALGDRVRSARGPAEAALAEFLRALQEEYGPRSAPEFALGPERFQRLLWVREGIDTPFAEIERAGREDLDRNQARLAELARAGPAPGSVSGMLEELYRDHPGATELLGEARAMVEESRKFVEEHGLARVPPGAQCRVEETPVYGRALSTASMNPPGPYDTVGDEGIYFITPVDAGWTPERQEEWLRSLNRPMLRNITFHEVYPGHYLQFLHFRAGAGSSARKVYLSGSFAEGWAHYCEQLVIEQGYRAAEPMAEVAQLHDALLRDCRLLAAIGLHTRGMTLHEATELFRKSAHMESLPAEREAIRGTFNPEYFCYTLGKLAILRAREKYLGSTGPGALGRFHDRLLSFGCPPVGLLDRLFAGG